MLLFVQTTNNGDWVPHWQALSCRWQLRLSQRGDLGHIHLNHSCLLLVTALA